MIMSFLQALKSSIELTKIKIILRFFYFYPKGIINDDYFSIKIRIMKNFYMIYNYLSYQKTHITLLLLLIFRLNAFYYIQIPKDF